jgi:hypothetical protein
MVVVQSAADQVQVRIVQAGDHGAAVQVEHLAARLPEAHHVLDVADGEEAAILHGDRSGLRLLAVEGGETAVDEDEGRRGAAVGLCLHVLLLSPGAGRHDGGDKVRPGGGPVVGLR